MNRVIVEGDRGGKLMVDEQANVIAFFSRRFALGSSCEVMLGPVLDELLALKPGEHLQRKVEGIDDICVCEAHDPAQAEYPKSALYIVSSYWHIIDMIVISQDKLRQAAQWASVAARCKAASD